MFRYERVNSTRKFTIVALIVFLLKKIYKEDVPLGAVFKVKTLAVFNNRWMLSFSSILS